MQRYLSSAGSETKRSAKRIELPSGSSAKRYETHLPSANSGNAAESNGSPYWNEAPRMGQRHSAVCPSATISAEMVSSFGDISTIRPGVPPVLLGLRKPICNCDLLSRHFPNIRNASEDEMLFMQLALSFGALEAECIAARLDLKCRRGLGALAAKLSPRGRDYTKQPAQTTRSSEVVRKP